MEKKKCYLAPEAELRTTKIRCSILAGSDVQSNVTGPGGVGFESARQRGSSLEAESNESSATRKSSLGF